ncbi:MAG: hypothetical protein HDQ88_04975 [Clostridia bacterium]|nr:hypothetical protein [Clostridia bacterium]
MGKSAIDTHADVLAGLTIDKLRKIAKAKQYQIFDKGQYNLNIWGVRCDTENTKEFNDLMLVFYKEPISGAATKWVIKAFSITTDPSDLNLINPINSKGCAILKEGQYISAFKLGLHKGDYKALVQNTPLPLYRDFDKNDKLNISGKYNYEMAGINIHRASKWKISRMIGLYSAGCQVFESVRDYEDQFMPLVEQAAFLYGKLFSYTLINIEDLKHV